MVAQPNEPKKTRTIFVNTKPFEISEKKVSYETIVNLEYNNNPPRGENILITVKYRKGEGNAEGVLTPGESVPVKEGMIFNVSATDRS